MRFSWDTPAVENLLRAILALKTPDEARRFFRDLLTAEELAEFSRRWQAAQMLATRRSYTEIVSQTGLSSTTVARVAKWLNGALGGYRLILDRQHHLNLKRSPHQAV